MTSQQMYNFQHTLSGGNVPTSSGDPVISRLAGIFSSLQETSYGSRGARPNLFGWQAALDHFTTDACSIQPALRVLLPERWHETLSSEPETRAALQDALGKVASGQSSVESLLQGWGDILTVSGLLRIVSDGNVVEIDAAQAAAAHNVEAARPALTKKEPGEKKPEIKAAPPHARLAGELREATGLSAGKLASAFGVSREQYSRWVSGAPISDMRHGQLRYLHTVVADLVRRLGSVSEARVWFQTPLRNGEAPCELLIGRRWSELYRVVTEVPDAAPVVDGVRVALLAPLAEEEDNPQEPEEADGEDSWSPYT